MLNDFMVFSSVRDLVIHCWAPLSWSSPLISTKLISSRPRFLLPCSRLNCRRKLRGGGPGGDSEVALWDGLGAPVPLRAHVLPCHLPSDLGPSPGT